MFVEKIPDKQGSQMTKNERKVYLSERKSTVQGKAIQKNKVVSKQPQKKKQTTVEGKECCFNHY